MSHIFVRKSFGDKVKFADREWWYHFRSLPRKFEDTSVKEYVQQLYEAYSKLTKAWNDDLNSEWICRIYLGLKMVLSASVMLESLDFSKRKNLRIVFTYLEYYSILSSLRAVVFTSPLSFWQNGDIIRLPHKKTINIACDILVKFDRDLSGKIKQYVLYLKGCRELISYRAPSSGDSFPKIDIGVDVVELCQVLVEIAQLQSEILENSVHKHIEGNFLFKDEYIDQICISEIDGNVFRDKEDEYRMGYLRRKHPLPTNILHMMSEGHIEDFFGSWCVKDETDEDVFDPDENWQIIFDVP